MNRLQKQLENPDKKKDAEDCIKIYNWLKDIDENGKVWSSRWTPLVNFVSKGFPDGERIYKPNAIGYMLLKGLRHESFSKRS